jgi:outer membrane protein assembly factor BamA
VRSFEESQLGPLDRSGEPAGGLAYNVISLELRRRMRGNLAGSLFFDYGNVAPNRTRSEEGEDPYDSRSEIISDTLRDYWDDFRPAIGAGIQYLLPVGPARLDFAFNPDARKDRGEDGFVWHFSVGMAF